MRAGHRTDAKGVPVATVAIDGADNAALLAAQILAVSEPALADKLEAQKQEMARQVLEKDKKLQAEAAGTLKKRTKRMMKMPKGDYCNMEEITYEKAGTVV